jgi:simple sugar transport system permease protein
MRGWRLEPRTSASVSFNAAVTAVSVLIALVIGGALMFLMNVNPFAAYGQIIREALGSRYGLSETLVKAAPITLTGLACLYSFKMLIWNIGAEGQLVAGAIASAAVVRYFYVDSSVAMFILMMAASAAAGGLWGAIPGFLKGRWNVNEIIATLMLNYIALYMMDFLLYGAWKDPTSMGFPMTAQFPAAARLARFGGTRLHMGAVIAVALSLLTWVIMRRTQWGFEIRVIGENQRAARYAGMSIMRNILLVMFVSGAVAGICGFCEVAGLQGRLSRGFAVGYGFTGVIVAWLARLNPLAVPLVSFLMGILLVGGDTLQVVMSLPLSSVQVIQGVILFSILGGEMFSKYRIRRAGSVSPGGALPGEAE